MSNRWVNAFVKTLIFLVIVHIITLILGAFMGTHIGWFGLAVFWPHWNTILNGVIAVVLTVVIYFVIYAFFTNNSADQI